MKWAELAEKEPKITSCMPSHVYKEQMTALISFGEKCWEKKSERNVEKSSAEKAHCLLILNIDGSTKLQKEQPLKPLDFTFE